VNNSELFEPASWDSTMVVCKGSVADQCAAETLCNTGWHLCTASEYRAQGGRAEGTSSSLLYWIGGCIRSGGQPYAPRDGLCSSTCISKPAPATYLGFFCSDGKGTWLWGVGVVGLTTTSTCLRAGVNDVNAEAYWRPSDVTRDGDGAVCCR